MLWKRTDPFQNLTLGMAVLLNVVSPGDLEDLAV